MTEDKKEISIDVYIGIDPSINSTGITIMSDLGKNSYYLYNRMFVVKSKLTKKESKLLDEYYNKNKENYNILTKDFLFKAVIYEHEDANIYNKEKNKDAHMFELTKTNNLISITAKIKQIILYYISNMLISYETSNNINNNENIIYNIIIHSCIETNSFNSRARSVSLVELCGLNFLIRNMLLNLYKEDHFIMNVNIKMNLICATPTEIKKFATYRGDADKELMKICFDLLHQEITDKLSFTKLDDVIDSYFMCMYAININELNKTDKEYTLYDGQEVKDKLNDILNKKKEFKKEERNKKKQLKNKENIWDNEMLEFADEI